MEPLIITLDGPAGSGKSSVAQQLAKRLGVAFLDTGAMYRGIAAAALAAGIDPAVDPEATIRLAKHSSMDFDWTADPPRLIVSGRDLTDRLRDADVTVSVSDVASIPGVRHVLVEAQRRIGQAHPRLVTEGRDQGSVVFPNAQVKFYMDARPQIRAHRRAEEQLHQTGKPADEAQILELINRRDYRDANRADGPLVCPADAIRVDTSDMTLEEVVDHLEKLARERVGK